MSHREKRKYQIDSLPENLQEALDLMEKDKLVKEALGEHIYTHFMAAKREEWHEYIAQVHPWEVDRYLTAY